MLKKYNDNIICGFFKAMAAFWDNAAKYQIYAILAAMTLLAILPLFVTKMSETTNVILNITIFCAVAVGGFLVFKLKGLQMAAFTFAAALLLRLCLVFVLETSTPNMLEGVRIRTSPWINHYDTTLFQPDEYFYFYYGQEYKDTTIDEFISSPPFKDQACRAGFLLSRIFSFFGGQSLWPRLVGAFLGAFAAAFVCLSAQKFFSKETSAIISLLAAFGPQTAFYSVRFLKETWIIFAASLIVFGFAVIIRNKKLFLAVLSITAAILVLLWVRFEYALVFIAAVPIALCFMYKSNSIGKIAAVIMVIVLGVIIFAYQFNQLAHKAGNLYDKYTITKRGQGGRLESVEVIDTIHKSRGPLRLLNIPLAMLNPPPRNLHHIYTAEKKLFDIVVLSDIYQWWLPLPFLIIGIIIIISRKTEFLAFLLPYLLAISIAAMLLGGLEVDTLRYRDSLAPIAFIIIGAGIESFTASPKGWKNSIIMAVYAGFVICTVLAQIVVYS
jgi:hypothetical protein